VPKGALSGLGIDALTEDSSGASTSGTTPSWLDTIKNLITSAGQAYLTKTQVDAQKKILDIQLGRAQAGLAPLNINPTTYGLPAPTVNFGVSSDTQKVLMYGLLGLGGVFVAAKIDLLEAVMKTRDILLLAGLAGAVYWLASRGIAQVSKALTSTGEAIGSGLFDFFHPHQAGELLYYSVTFPNGDRHAIASGNVDSNGLFRFALPPMVEQTWQMIVDANGNKYATVT